MKIANRIRSVAVPATVAALIAHATFDKTFAAEPTHRTIVGDVRFGADGEWEQARIFQVQYQGITGNGLEQFECPGTQVILFPSAYKSGKLQYPLPE